MTTPARIRLDPELAARNRRRLHLREIVDDGPESNGSVGAELRAARVRAGLDLREVGDALRIRYKHLEALECNYFDDLPGKTYAVGFVRAYAEHLGLKPDDLVRRFKTEMGDVAVAKPVPEPAQTWSLPEPADDEAKLPTGISVIVVSLLAIGIGVGWYATRSPVETAEAEVAPPPTFVEAEVPLLRPHPSVPVGQERRDADNRATRLADALNADDDPAVTQSQTAAQAEAVAADDAGTEAGAAPLQSIDVADAESLAGTAPSQEDGGATAGDETSDDADTQSQTAAAELDESEPAPLSERVVAATRGGWRRPEALTVPMGSTLARAPVRPVLDDRTIEEGLERLSQEPSVTPLDLTPLTLDPADAGADETDLGGPALRTETMADVGLDDLGLDDGAAAVTGASRVQVLALRSAWLRVDNGDGTVLVQRQLREGEVIPVPAADGLVMAARNAGAFQILVDGRPIGRAGQDGEVLSGLSLNVWDLKQRELASGR